jgi:hypothetical protein
MEPNVVILIERLISIDPEKRPTVMEVLTSELLPQEEIFEKLQQHLVNYKNPMKLKLMRFLCQLPTSKTLDITYFGSYKYRELFPRSVSTDKLTQLVEKFNRKNQATDQQIM